MMKVVIFLQSFFILKTFFDTSTIGVQLYLCQYIIFENINIFTLFQVFKIYFPL